MLGVSTCIPHYPETLSIEIAQDQIELNHWTVQPDGKINGYLNIGQGEGKPPTLKVSDDPTSTGRRLENQDAFGFSLQTQHAWRPVGSVQLLEIVNLSGVFAVERDGTFDLNVNGRGNRLSIANGSLLVQKYARLVHQKLHDSVLSD